MTRAWRPEAVTKFVRFLNLQINLDKWFCLVFFNCLYVCIYNLWIRLKCIYKQCHQQWYCHKKHLMLIYWKKMPKKSIKMKTKGIYLWSNMCGCRRLFNNTEKIYSLWWCTTQNWCTNVINHYLWSGFCLLYRSFVLYVTIYIWLYIFGPYIFLSYLIT